MIYKEAIPINLKRLPQWVLWRYISRGEGKKPDKQPVNAKTLHNAGVHWPNTWNSFYFTYDRYLETCTQGMAGIGFVLTHDPFIAIDIDNCISDRTITSTAQAIIATLSSYTELSPSGHGLRILVACPHFTINRRTATVEFYSTDRYVTITGNHLEGTPQQIRTVDHQLLTTLIPPPSLPEIIPHRQASEAKHAQLSNQDLWERIFRFDRYGATHKNRFFGDLSHDRNDHSFAVVRLLNCLARWTHGDTERMRAMLLMSPLCNEKWFTPRGSGDWLDHQIADATAYSSGRKGHA